MKDTKEIEFSIFLCMMFGYEMIEMDEKYFTYKKEYLFLKKLRDRYPYIQLTGMEKYFKDIDKYSKFLDDLWSLEETDFHDKGILSYYKLLKDTYNDNQIYLIQQQYNEGKITKKEYERKLSIFSEEETEPLTLNEINEIEEVEREYTNIKELDYLTKGIEYGAITIWTGVTNAGKTTMVTQFARECLNNGKKIFFFAGEQSAIQFKNSLYLTMCKQDEIEYIQDKHNDLIKDAKPTKQKTLELDTKFKGMVYLYDNNIKSHSLKSILNSMEQCVNYGVRIFFIDNFMQIENTEKLEEQTNVIEQIKQFAMRNNVIVNLVVHPRKIQNQSSRLSIFDISGSQNISNKATNIITIMRVDNLIDDEKKNIGKVLAKNFYDIEECNSIIEVLKTKGNECKMVGLKYNKENKIYYESKRDWNISTKKNTTRR